MRKLFLVLAVAGLLVGLVGSAHAAVFGVDVFDVELGAQRRVVSIDGEILCSTGQKFWVNVRVSATTYDASAYGRDTGTCGSSWTFWDTAGSMVFTDKFVCGTTALVRGVARTEDGHRVTFRERVPITC